MNSPTIKQATVFLPFAMSIIAISMVLVNAAIFGIVEEADEGTAAHLFQLLLILQLPFIAFLAISWLAHAPIHTLKFIALQVPVAFAAMVAAYFLTS